MLISLINLLWRIWLQIKIYNTNQNKKALYSELEQCPRGEAHIPEDWSEIEAERFAYCAGLRSIIISDSVLEIGERAFYYCHNLFSVDLGKGVQVIKTESFQYCSSLKTLHLPASVTKIGGAPLAGCTSLVKFTVDPRNSNYMECDGVLFEVNETLISSFQCPSGKTGSYKIPPYVSFIGNGSFAECRHLTSVEIPRSVVAIHEYAFYSCERLQTVNIPSGCKELRGWAFCLCSSLYSINPDNRLPDSITEIGERAFDRCNNLSRLEFGSNLKTVGKHAFGDSGIESVTFPVTLELVGPWAFQLAHSLRFVDFGGSSAYLDQYAFVFCSKLETVVNADNITYCGRSAWELCGSITAFPAMQNLLRIDMSCFRFCKSLGSFSIGPYCDQIGLEAFYGCENLTEIVFGESLTAIGELAFAYCALSSVYIPGSVVSIGGCIFLGCELMTEISVDEQNSNFMSRDGVLFGWVMDWEEWRLWQYPCGRAGSYDVPAVFWHDDGYEYPIGVVNFGAFGKATKLTEVHFETYYDSDGYIFGCWGLDTNAFAMCSSLTSITLPESLQSIWDNAFWECLALTEIFFPRYVALLGVAPFYKCLHVNVTVDPDNIYYVSRDGALLYNDGKRMDLFVGGETVYEVPKGVEVLGRASFLDARVTEVTIPDTVTTIEEGCFYGATLRSIVLPNSVQTVGTRPFIDCFDLESVQLSVNLNNISDNMFTNCTSLKSIVIPDSVVSIGREAFYECYALKSVQFGENVESIGSGAFYDCMSLVSVRLPVLLTSISNSTFVHCETLESIVIGNSVRVIEHCAFEYCSSLVSVSILDFVEVIEDGAFANCSSLVSIVLGPKITIVNANVFINCVSLTSVYLPEAVAHLADLAFSGCVQLTNVTYNGTSEPSGSLRVFSGCAILTEVHVPGEYLGKTFLSLPVMRPGDDVILISGDTRNMLVIMLCTSSVVAIMIEIVSFRLKEKRRWQIKKAASEASVSLQGSSLMENHSDISLHGYLLRNNEV